MRANNFIFVFPLLLTACTVGPNFSPPHETLDPVFSETSATTGTDPSSQPSRTTSESPAVEWWKNFNDPKLDHLIDLAQQNNLDLQIATARIRESRAQRNIIAADLFPEVDADAGTITARGSKNVKIPLGGLGGGSPSNSGAQSANLKPALQSNSTASDSSPNPSSGGSNSAGGAPNVLSPFGKGGLPGVTTSLFQMGFDANWELDIFGGTARRIEAANYDIAASIEARRDLLITLTAEVARNYIQLRSAQQRLTAAHDNLAVAQSILDLSAAQAKAGLSTELDTTRASAQLYQTVASIPPLEAQVRTSIHALSILVAQPPNALAADLAISDNRLPAAPPLVPIGLPSDLLLRRPDIRQALRQVASANAKIGSATADLFPKFALTGSIGLDASNITNILNFQSRYFLISPTVSWPIFDAGRIVSNISLQKSLHYEAQLQYKKTILTALQEVEDALINYATEQARNTALTNAEAQAALALTLAKAQYQNGLTDFLTVLDAQRTLLAAQDTLLQSNAATLTSLITLYKSLGGGWGKSD